MFSKVLRHLAHHPQQLRIIHLPGASAFRYHISGLLAIVTGAWFNDTFIATALENDVQSVTGFDIIIEPYLTLSVRSRQDAALARLGLSVTSNVPRLFFITNMNQNHWVLWLVQLFPAKTLGDCFLYDCSPTRYSSNTSEIWIHERNTILATMTALSNRCPHMNKFKFTANKVTYLPKDYTGSDCGPYVVSYVSLEILDSMKAKHKTQQSPRRSRP